MVQMSGIFLVALVKHTRFEHCQRNNKIVFVSQSGWWIYKCIMNSLC